ncbi:acetolactate synthase [Ophiostoma piceae UAMH 11346]|uniref:Acetolactate synthase n=1 Tax=Ophiostoma piceae (strain UAMH 11346) TaxID=1262450 RepID=S3CA87_OPHP1|nr:acetolactate synthase [Ophiostoma piceae UAMH 11346]
MPPSTISPLPPLPRRVTYIQRSHSRLRHGRLSLPSRSRQHLSRHGIRRLSSSSRVALKSTRNGSRNLHGGASSARSISPDIAASNGSSRNINSASNSHDPGSGKCSATHNRRSSDNSQDNSSSSQQNLTSVSGSHPSVALSKMSSEDGVKNNADPEMYTTSFAFFEALWEAGVTHCFVNLGSDHPSIIEAMVRSAKESQSSFPRIITCPNEMVAMSMADGYARLTGKPQCVIVHVDVGTQGLGAAVHNASMGRAPVLVFAGISPFTIEGEMRGSRTEYIHWIQDVPDQKQILGQYCRYSAELKTGRNVKQMVNRALSFATSSPAGPVYLCGAREVMEEEIKPYHLKQEHWKPVQLGGLPQPLLEDIGHALSTAKEPLLVIGYSGRNHAFPPAVVKLADAVARLCVLDTGGSDMNFPADHPAWLGLRYGSHDAIRSADVIVVIDCDVPWINTQCSPHEDARIFHIDCDPLKRMMPVFYLAAEQRVLADTLLCVQQLNGYFMQYPIMSELTVTNTIFVHDNLQPTLPGQWINCGGGGLGWSGGGALGIKLATDYENGGLNKGRFVCQIVGDGTFLFSVPGSVYWISRRYGIPILTIVLNNKGWNAPRRSLLLVHPDGLGSKSTNDEINIEFNPSPDYGGIAKAAAYGELFTARVDKASELKGTLQKAVESVINGTSAVVDCKVAMGC